MDTKTLVFALRCCSSLDPSELGCDVCPLEYLGKECQKLCVMAADVIDAARNSPKWFDAKDHLPPTLESVFVIANGKYGNMTLVDAMEFGVYDDIDKAWYLESGPIDGPVNVTWWMYLPEPPRKD